MMPSRAVELALAALLLLVIATCSDAQVLGVEGDRFTLNGQPRFLVFVSYFDGVRRIPDNLASTTVLDADLEYLVSKGVSGVRIFPNWQSPGETLMQCDGALRPLQLEKLTRLIDRAAAKGLVVDVSFTIDTVKNTAGHQCLSASDYKKALDTVTSSLAGKTSILFDLQNEHDKNRPPADSSHPKGWTPQQWADYLGATIVPAVKSRDASRLVTVSWTSDATPLSVFSYVQNRRYDVLAYHHRGPGWETKTTTYATRFKRLFADRGPRRPIYLQEPNRFPFDTEVAHYESAVANAKGAGAAAWTFHNSVVEQSKPLNGTTPFERLLAPGERSFLDRLNAAIAGPVAANESFRFAEMSLGTTRAILRAQEAPDEDQSTRFLAHGGRCFGRRRIGTLRLVDTPRRRRFARLVAAAAFPLRHRTPRRRDDGEPQFRSSFGMVAKRGRPASRARL